MTLAERIAAEQAELDVLVKAQADQSASLAEIARLKALLAAVPPPPPPPPSAAVLWSWPATSVAPFGIHARPPHSERVSLVTVGGRPGVRLLTKSGDNNVNGSNLAERCDLRLGNDISFAREGLRIRFKHGIWFPADYVDLPASIPNGMWHWGSCMNWHDDADTAGSQGPLQLMTMPKEAGSQGWPTGLIFQVYGGTPGNVKRGESVIGAIERLKWYDLVFDIGWSATAGFCTASVNGREFMKYTGPTLLTGNGAYLKLANYHSAMGKDSAVVHGAITVEALA